jgi:hypothetical protein
MLTYAAISGDRNVIKKEDKKILKNKEVTIQIQHTWNVKSDTSRTRQLQPSQNPLENT